jgi:hypothetical protein
MNIARIEFDSNEVAQVVDELVWIGHLWGALRSPIVRLAFEQTVKRLGGQVRLHPEPEETWSTDLQLAVIDSSLVAKISCDAEIVVDLQMPHKVMVLYDRYYDHKVRGADAGRRKYDTIWDFTPNQRCIPDVTTITPIAFDSLTTWAGNRGFQFVGGPWWDTVINSIIHRYERLLLTQVSRSEAPVRFVLADVELPTKKNENTILFPRNVVAGYWAKQFTLAAAALAITM